MAKKQRARRQPQRTCIACQQTSGKRELVRIVRTPDGHVQIDETGKRAGRGAYLCRRRACWIKALERRAIGRALKIQLSEADRRQITAFADALPAGPNE